MSGWLLGWAVGGGVVLVVGVVLLLLIAAARRTARTAEEIVDALHEAEAATAGLWKLEETVRTTGRLREAAAAATEQLGRGRP